MGADGATLPAGGDAVAIYDTTLRDGAQQQGVSFTVGDKLSIIALLDELGAAYIEAGWPGAIPKDTELFARARELDLATARLVAFGATRRPGARAAEDSGLRALLDSGAETITLVAKSDPRHVERALRATREENLHMVADSTALLVGAGRETMVDLEHFFDGLRRDADGQPYGIEVALAAARAGASAVIACDTNGGALPGTIADSVARLRRALDAAGHPDCVVGIHTHDDSGLAVAGAMAAVEAGARQVQGCVNGMGERTGNAELLTIIANLELKTRFTALPGDEAERARRLSELSRVSRSVGEIANRAPSTRQAYTGARAFAHKAGLHASAIRVDPDLYQHVDPARVGNTMSMLVSEMAGRASIELKARELGIDASGQGDVLGRVAEEVKAREAVGYAYDAADGSFELLLRHALGEPPDYFRVESWQASVRAAPVGADRLLPVDGSTHTQAEATVRLRAGGRRFAVLGEGNGPVNALDAALCDALAQVYPEIRAFELTDYKVRILDAERGTRAIIRVLIDLTDGERTWSTVGVGTDIVEATWEALTDGHVVGLIRAGVSPR
ncbi:citramalate synthase [Actinomyces sp. zg296]|uniref:citramalate synthase n=1 Tax=Actinomyces sp. zg296 TaxID=2609289 RepID=UPI001357A81E|nr:citramalate synthase [Actinomyces sp. zg296]